MNRQDAFQYVTEYWALVKKGEKQPPLSGDRRAVMRDVNRRLPTVNKILHSLAPDLNDAFGERSHDAVNGLRSDHSLAADDGGLGGLALFGAREDRDDAGLRKIGEFDVR